MSKRGNQEGSIYRRKSDGKWCASVTLGRQKNGKFKRKIMYGNTRQEVAAKLHDALELTRQGVDISAGNITVQDWTHRYFKIYKESTLRPLTYEGYLVTAKNYIYPYIGHRDIADLRPDIIQEWLNTLMTTPQKYKSDKTLSARTVNLARTILKASLEQACRDGVIIRNPVNGTKPAPKDPRKWQALTRDDQKKIVKHLNKSVSDYANMFLFALYTGLRPSEAAALKWSNVDMQSRSFKVKESVQTSYGKTFLSHTKTSSGDRVFPMTDEIYALLHDQENAIKNIANPLDLVFPSRAGSYLDGKNVARALKQEFKEAGVPYTSMRGLRHTFGTRAAEAGVNPAITQQLMGHSSSQITLDYYTEAQTEAKLNALSMINGVNASNISNE